MVNSCIAAGSCKLPDCSKVIGVSVLLRSCPCVPVILEIPVVV